MADPDFIVSEMVAVKPDGSRFDIVVRIGKPVPDDGPYVCVIQMDGIDEKPRPVYGEDPMQALHLGLQLVRENLTSLEEFGMRLYLRDQEMAGEPHDWRHFWYGEDKTTK